METFEACRKVNDLLEAGQEAKAREVLIQLLDERGQTNEPYGELVNYMIRATGLYPYLQPESAAWGERYIYEAFKVDIGMDSPATLHREQSLLLRRLVDGEDLAISAPTSFGKSFVIDAFIAIRRPINVMVIVPTLALTDETRRRLHRKFGHEYKIITTAGVALGDRNILIFPQERAQGYLTALETIDLLVIDEFYKASPVFDRDRSPSLLKAILQLKDRARQRYFLAPNIATMKESPFTKGMRFERLDFNTVYLEKNYLYPDIGKDAVKKSNALLSILSQSSGKTLIYAGTYSGIEKVGALLTDHLPVVDSGLLNLCSEWLNSNYDPTWTLTNLIKRGVGVHNGRLHRALSQIQVRMFEDPHGLRVLIATSSIVEGVNTSAENVILWSNRKGQPRLDDFTYKNIIGRGGRMFRHFVGKVFVLEKPPEEEEAQLDLAVPDELLGALDEEEYREDLTDEQIARIIEYRAELRALVGPDAAVRLERSTDFQTSDWSLVRRIVQAVTSAPEDWRGLGALNGSPKYWDRSLYKVINLQPGGWETAYSKFVVFVKILEDNWSSTIPELLYRLEDHDIGIDTFFQLERNATFKLAALFNDVSIVMREILGRDSPDISYFVGRLSSAFLPPLVYQLEEYGLPRMIARKIHDANLMDLTEPELVLHDVILRFVELGNAGVFQRVTDLDAFDQYMVQAFIDGIQTDQGVPIT